MKVNTGRVENKKKYTEEIEIVIKKFNDLKKNPRPDAPQFHLTCKIQIMSIFEAI